MYELKSVSKTDIGRVILENININIPDTGLIFIKGDINSGKSVLLNIFSLIERPSYGQITFNNQDITNLDEKTIREYRLKYISSALNKDTLIDNLSVYDNITLINKIKYKDILNKEIINILNLGNILKKKINKLTEEERKKCEIARCLLKDSNVYILDNADTLLDNDTKTKLYTYLRDLSNSKLIIWSTDSNEYDNYGNAIISLNTGRMISIANIQAITGVNPTVNIKPSFNTFKITIKSHFSYKLKLILLSILLICSYFVISFYMAINSLDYNKVHNDTLNKKEEYIIQYEKKNSDILTDNEIDYLNKNKLSSSALILGRTLNINNEYITFQFNDKNISNIPYYYNHKFNLSYVYIDNFNSNLLVGELPSKNNEIVISEYLADYIIKYGILKRDNTYYNPSSYEDIINDKETLYLNGVSVNIVGIYKSLYNNYNSLKNVSASSDIMITNLNTLLDSEITLRSSAIYVMDDFFDIYDNMELTLEDAYIYKINGNITINSMPIMYKDDIEIPLNTGISLSSLGDYDIVVNENMYKYYGLYIGDDITIDILDSEGNKATDTITLHIVGISSDGNYYINNKALQSIVHKTIEINKAYLYESDYNTRSSLINNFAKNNTDYQIRTIYSNSITNFKNLIIKYDSTLKAICIFLVLISIAVLYSYLSNTISSKKKDNAVMTILGIKESKIQLTYFIEISIILIVNYILSIIIFIVGKSYINNYVSKYLLFNVDIMPIYVKYFIYEFIAITVILTLINFSVKSSRSKLKREELVKLD